MTKTIDGWPKVTRSDVLGCASIAVRVFAEADAADPMQAVERSFIGRVLFGMWQALDDERRRDEIKAALDFPPALDVALTEGENQVWLGHQVNIGLDGLLDFLAEHDTDEAGR